MWQEATQDRCAWRGSEPRSAEVQVERCGLGVGVEVRTGVSALCRLGQDVAEQQRTSDFSAKADKKAATSSSTSTAAQNLPGRAGKIITAGEVVLALSPVFIEAANLISASQREAAQVKAERDRLDRIEEAVEHLGKQVANQAIASFETAVNEVNAGPAEAAEAVVRAEAAATSKIDYVESAQVAATALLARMSAE